MTAYQSLVSINGTSSQVPAADSLLVGTSVDTVANSGANSILSVGGTNATAITITPSNGAGTGDITIDASVAGGSSNLLTLDGASVTVMTSANGYINLNPGNNGALSVNGGGADVDVIVGSAGPANALFVQGSDGFVGVNTNAPSVGFDARAQALFRNPADSTTALSVQNAATTTVFDVDTTNGRVGIGTNAPSVLLDVRGNVAGAVESRVTNASTGAGAFASLRAYGDTANVGAVVFGFGSANGNTQFQSISLNDAAAFTTDTSVANLFISTRNATAPIHIGTNSDFNGPRAIEIAANQGNVTVNPDGASGVDFIVEGDTNTDLLHVDASADAVGIGLAAPSTVLHVDSNAANTTAILTIENTAGDFQVFRVDATPQSAVTGNVGDLANDTTNGVLYLKTSGSATNTGWSALSTGGGPASGVEIDFDTSSVAIGAACYASAAGVASAADATTPASPYRAARVLGIATTSAASGKIAVSGLVNATFAASLTLNVGDPAYLSETAGQLTNDVSGGAGFGTGDAVAEVGIITDVLSYNGASNFTVEILFQPKSITIL